jgi:integrase/recombinase XerD
VSVNRAREVAALTLDDIDWKRDRLSVPGRKAGHSTAFPLSAVVGEALVDYLRHGRPPGSDRHVFFRAVAPVRPASGVAVSACARHCLLKAGIQVPRRPHNTARHRTGITFRGT